MHLKSIVALGLVPGLLAARTISPSDVDCDEFEAADTGDTCASFAAAWDVSVDKLTSLNPDLDCSGFDDGGIYCVAGSVTSDDPSSTTTKAPVETCNPSAPSPTQPGAVCGCDKWHKVASSSTTCEAIISYEGIAASDFSRWNPQINKGCTNLFLGYYVCVHVDGASPPPTTTSKAPSTTCNANAPTPTQPGAVCKCDKWHKVASSSTTCDAIIAYENISKDNFYKWNPKVNKSCSNIFLGYWLCVHVAGTPTHTTTASPPQETCHKGAPEPVQPGAVCNCKKWHLVSGSSTTCDAIIAYEHISANNFYKWNPKINRSCNNLFVRYYVCVGV